jgi:calcium-dependent protein kinase
VFCTGFLETEHRIEKILQQSHIFARIVMDSAALRAECVTPGRVEDDYTIGAVIGSGGYVVSYQYINTRSCLTYRECRYASVRKGTAKGGEQVAVKIFDQRYALRDERMATKLLFEVFVLKRVGDLHHPNLAGFLAAYEDTDDKGRPRLSIVSPLYTGGELFDSIVARGHYTEADAAKLFASICSGVQALHSHGMTHRDLKPENVIMSSRSAEAEPVLCDYGFATVDGFVDLYASQKIGTYSYMAPEIYTRCEYGPPVDAWALGVLLYTVLVGYPPCWVPDENDTAALRAEIVSSHYQFHEDAWGSISSSAKDLVRGLLTADPKTRITVHQALCHPWITTYAPTCTKHLAAATTKLAALSVKQRLHAAARAVIWAAVRAPKGKHATAAVGCDFSLSSDEMNALRTAFRHHAKGSSTINVTGFRKVMTDAGLEALPLDRVFEIFDVDGSGTIDLRELVTGLVRLQKGGLEEHMRLLFDMFDLDDSDSLTPEEIARLLVGCLANWHIEEEDTSLTLTSCSNKLSHAGEDLAIRLANLFARMDRNSDGRSKSALHAPAWPHTMLDQ